MYTLRLYMGAGLRVTRVHVRSCAFFGAALKGWRTHACGMVVFAVWTVDDVRVLDKFTASVFCWQAR